MNHTAPPPHDSPGDRATPLVVAVGVGLLIVPRAIRVARKAIRILAISAPPSMTPEGVAGVLGGIAGVVDVRDVHLRILTSGMNATTACLVIRSGIEARFVLDEAYERLRYSFGVDHAAFEVESESAGGADRSTGDRALIPAGVPFFS